MTSQEQYDKILTEYIELGHLSPARETTEETYYLPHHAVFKEESNTTKIRIVFDASAKKDKGIALNDTLMVGPTIQDRLVSHLIRFRTYRYVLTADIAKMYRQVWMHEDDKRYQRILWRQGGQIRDFNLNTLVFGISSSPFLATRTLQKSADDESQNYARAAKILKTRFYMDDLITGADSINDAKTIRDEIIVLLAKGGFIIRLWASNNYEIIKELDRSSIHTNFTIEINRTLKTLGIKWCAKEDKIIYEPAQIRVVERLTKRNVLSEIAKVYDPLGLLGPVIFYIKRLMQDVWCSGIHWDESVTQEVYSKWIEFARQ
ncbi:uncharacterized protein [Prorops nasuta]|uniref:uncharacterized protein n=1 Tax=Prorops nasuta TaxID=863751 RepID=UPI0034CE7BC2